ncbi:hypothetical protein BRD02_06740 [Halobacteriales archaeon QS_8_69_73]|nr:MAG: hypothetical protein BRD02_06740 [Halobacteriales archaeon QS_8_69_73]
MNALTGGTPAYSRTTVEEATAFAAGTDADTSRIALPASVETRIEARSKPHTTAAFTADVRERISPCFNTASRRSEPVSRARRVPDCRPRPARRR